MAEFDRILVVRGGAIGDFILTLPVFSALRETFRPAVIGSLAPVGRGELAMAAGLADEIQDLDGRGWAEFFVSDGDLDPERVIWLSQFDLIISFLHDPEGVWVNNLKRISSARLLQGCSRPSENGKLHATAVLLSVLKEVGISGLDSLPQIDAGATDPDRYVLAVHPGSGSESKNWPEVKWLQFLTQWLEGNSGRVLVVGGEAEAVKLIGLKRVIDPVRVVFLENESLPELAGALKSARFFVGHDSGISHLAAALGVKSVILWGATNRVVWGPQHHHVRFIQSDEAMDSITVDEVLRAVEGALSSD
ncbi:MAG: glycosyltransferase family 9 protein [Verrucomicrobiota bacterium]|nr:glycosyltransferase family 9 protein [Verrucomicrobiota bacterium]